jgi:transcription elongation factor Elf1
VASERRCPVCGHMETGPSLLAKKWHIAGAVPACVWCGLAVSRWAKVAKWRDVFDHETLCVRCAKRELARRALGRRR